MSGQELALPRQRGVVAHQGNSAEARFLRWYAGYPRKVAIQAARMAYAVARCRYAPPVHLDLVLS